MNIIRTLTLEEALREFEAEVKRLEDESQDVETKYQNGYYALTRVYN